LAIATPRWQCQGVDPAAPTYWLAATSARYAGARNAASVAAMCPLAGVAARRRGPTCLLAGVAPTCWLACVLARRRGLACPLAGVAPACPLAGVTQTCWPAGAGTAAGGGGFRIQGRCGPGFPASPPYAVENRNTAHPRPASAEFTPSAAGE